MALGLHAFIPPIGYKWRLLKAHGAVGYKMLTTVFSRHARFALIGSRITDQTFKVGRMWKQRNVRGPAGASIRRDQTEPAKSNSNARNLLKKCLVSKPQTLGVQLLGGAGGKSTPLATVSALADMLRYDGPRMTLTLAASERPPCLFWAHVLVHVVIADMPSKGKSSLESWKR